MSAFDDCMSAIKVYAECSIREPDKRRKNIVMISALTSLARAVAPNECIGHVADKDGDPKICDRCGVNLRDVK